MKWIFLSLSLVMASPVLAADWAFLNADRVLSPEEVDVLTRGKTIVFYDEGQAKYSAGGAYSYTYASGESAYGSYSISEDGTVCIAYRNGFNRCDKYVQNADRIVLLTENGLRFPIRATEKK